MKRTLGIILATAVALTSAAPADESTALTIYSRASPGAIPPELYRPTPDSQSPYQHYNQQPIPGYAVVRHERPIVLEQGRSTIRFSDVAALIDPTTVAFRSLTDPAGTRVLEQSYQFDLVSNQKLLERFIDKTITVERIVGNGLESISGTLMSAQPGGLILMDGSGRIRTVTSYSSIKFPSLPGGLITRPTLVWDVLSRHGGEQQTRVSYQTSGITWWTDYNITFTPGENANAGLLDIGAWVSIINRSGATYKDAKLKLIAGDVARAPQSEMRGGILPRTAKGGVMDEKLGFEEKSFFEYHLYTLAQPTTIPDNSTKQIELFDAARDVPAEKVLVYYGLPWNGGYRPSPMTDRNLGLPMNKKVDVYLRFKNSKKNGLGIPLPSGRIRVSQADDGSLEFIGEDTIDHTPKDETVLIKLGSAFDVVGERKQTEFKVDSRRKWIDESVEITIRNHKPVPVKVIIKENLYRWSNWKITDSSHKYQKQDSRTVHFPVVVPKDGKVTVTYTVHYTW
jgi:hypothetical protein